MLDMCYFKEYFAFFKVVVLLTTIQLIVKMLN